MCLFLLYSWPFPHRRLWIDSTFEPRVATRGTAVFHTWLWFHFCISDVFFFFCVQLHVTVVSETLLRHAYNRRQRLAFLAPSSFVQ